MDNQELYKKLIQTETMVRNMVMRGISSNEELIEAVDKQFHPTTEWEQEMFSESIIYAKLGVLN